MIKVIRIETNKISVLCLDVAKYVNYNLKQILNLKFSIQMCSAEKSLLYFEYSNYPRKLNFVLFVSQNRQWV